MCCDSTFCYCSFIIIFFLQYFQILSHSFLFPQISLDIELIEIFEVFAMFLNYPLLSLLPDFKQTPLERSFCAWFH